MSIELQPQMPRDLRLHKGNPHDFDLTLTWLFESAKGMGAELNRSAIQEGILSDSLYRKEQVRRHLVEQIRRTRVALDFGNHTICGFNQGTIAYDLAKHFEDDEERERCEDGY